MLMAGGERALMRLERRRERRAGSGRRAVGSIAVALVLSGVVLLVTGHDPLDTLPAAPRARPSPSGRVLGDADRGDAAAASPGSAAAVAFRMGCSTSAARASSTSGAVAAAGVALALAGQRGRRPIAAMVVAGARRRVPPGRSSRASCGRSSNDQRDHHVADAQLRRRAVPQLPDLRLESRTGATPRPRAPSSSRRASALPGSGDWPTFDLGTSLVIPFGLLVVGVASRSWSAVLYTRTRFGFEVPVIGDSPRAARYAGMRTRRKILAVMALSGALAGHRRREPGRRLPPPARPARPAAAGLRLHRHRRRRARPLQPVRGRARGDPDRRAQQRGLRAAGRRLPGRARRHDAGRSSCSARSAASCSPATACASGARPGARRRPPHEQQLSSS